MLVRSVLSAARMSMVLPVTGAVLAVIVVPVWLPILLMVFTRLAHWVAVIDPAADTVVSADCPHPESVEPVLHTLLMLAPAVVLTKPL